MPFEKGAHYNNLINLAIYMVVKEIYNEESLLIRITEGDSNAFSILFHQNKNKVYTYAIKVLQSELYAEEVVQDVFMKIWINREALLGIDNFGGYLRIMTRNHALTALKKIALENQINSSKFKNWSEAHSDTENNITFRETRVILDKAIDRLTPQQKVIYTLCHEQGLKYNEVAQKLNISPLTVKTHMGNALQSIRVFLLKNADLISLFVFIMLKNKYL
jgi:RNA polymerase sigma-70 factor (ECF subfamily)